MGRQPTAIIIARHGARLDAADKSWHLSSPTPYDPPLTYGGWTQSRALGLRIASLLQSLEEDRAAAEALQEHGGQNKAPRKKLKVFIHASPFLRCIQTSIGLSAGISQYQGIASGQGRSDSRPRSSSGVAKPSPRLHAVDTTAEEVAARSSARQAIVKDNKTTLRVDAFLGEWLSPDYFDLITPPPTSPLMVAGAKSYLLRRSEEIKSQVPGRESLSLKKGSHGNLWSSARAAESEPSLPSSNSDEPLDMKQLLHHLPGRDRTSSYSGGRITPFGRSAVARGKSGERPSLGYNPPVPSYAISSTDHIPSGYVAHARKACVNVDRHWDSMREPLEWGDGGEYGEEWSAMHKRFRKGLGHLIEWYDHTGAVHVSDDDDEAVPGIEEENEEDGSSDDEDIAVVLVTHGAGCNALIGALTDQPVLLDVGMASVTMAVRKPENDHANGNHLSPVQSPTPESSPELPHLPRRSSSRTPGFSKQYEMKLIASADHLRPGIDPTRPLHTQQSSSPIMAASKTIPESRRRGTMTYTHAPIESVGNLNNDAPRRNTSTALGSIRRLSTTQHVQPQRVGSSSSGMSMTGLWSPTSPTLPAASQEDFGEAVKEKLESAGVEVRRDTPSPKDNRLGISFNIPPESASTSAIKAHNAEIDPTASVPSITTIAPSPSREAFDTVTELPKPQIPVSIGRTLSQKGLWGSAPNGIQARDRGPKRRWTLQQE